MLRRLLHVSATALFAVALLLATSVLAGSGVALAGGSGGGESFHTGAWVALGVSIALAALLVLGSLAYILPRR